MTVEEAKKILEKEGFKLEGPGRTGVVSEYYTKYESPKICEAMQIVCSAGYGIMMLAGVFDARKARLKKEYEENIKTPGPGEEQPKEKKGIIYPTTFPKADFYHKYFLNEGIPALKEAASQFNDALLDEQAKKIEELTKDKELMKKATLSQLDDFIEIYNLLTKESQKTKRLGKEIARLNGIIHDKNEEIKRKTKGCCELVAENVDLKEGLRKTESLLHDTREANSRNLDTCFKNEDLINELKEKLAKKSKLAKKYAKELSDSSLDLCKLEKKLKKQLKDKNAVLSDVAEELRLSKIREKNLVEVSQKYMKENEELKKELANKVVNKIDAQALKSAESALAYKEKVIADLGKELKAQKNMMDELSLKYDGAKYNLDRSEEVVKAKDRAVCALVEKVNQLELMIKQYEAMLSLSEADNSFKDAMLDHLSKSYDESQKRAAAFVYKSLSKSTEHGNGIADQMKPVRRKRKNTKK